MSHSVIITLESMKATINTCDCIIDKINKSLTYNWSSEIKQKMQDNLIKIKEEKMKLLSNVGIEQSDFSLDKFLSTISKEVENLELSMNFKKNYDDYIKENSGKIEEMIATYGILATESLEYLIKNKEKINIETLAKKIEEMRNVEIDSENLKKYQKIFKTNILNSDFSDNIKLEFMNISKQFKNIQEVSDIQPLISSKMQEFNNMKIMVDDVIKILAKLNFKLESKQEYSLSEEQVFNLRINFKNASNNIVAINFDSNGKIKYKLGNYVGHACEKTTDKLLDEISKAGYVYLKPLIRRDIDDAKPLMKSFKERGK